MEVPWIMRPNSPKPQFLDIESSQGYFTCRTPLFPLLWSRSCLLVCVVSVRGPFIPMLLRPTDSSGSSWRRRPLFDLRLVLLLPLALFLWLSAIAVQRWTVCLVWQLHIDPSPSGLTFPSTMASPGSSPAKLYPPRPLPTWLLPSWLSS
jgi:hypothetical protein